LTFSSLTYAQHQRRHGLGASAHRVTLTGVEYHPVKKDSMLDESGVFAAYVAQGVVIAQTQPL
jgi:hypothetical protein